MVDNQYRHFKGPVTWLLWDKRAGHGRPLKVVEISGEDLTAYQAKIQASRQLQISGQDMGCKAKDKMVG